MIKLTIKETVGDRTKEQTIELDNTITMNKDINAKELNSFLDNLFTLIK